MLNGSCLKLARPLLCIDIKGFRDGVLRTPGRGNRDQGLGQEPVVDRPMQPDPAGGAIVPKNLLHS